MKRSFALATTMVLLLGIPALLNYLSPRSAAAEMIADGSGGLRSQSISAFAASPVLTDTLSYLPIIFRRWPPIPDTPLLHPIQNADGNGSYQVDWDPAELADTYELQEDDNVQFSTPYHRYSGTSTYYNVSGKSAGTYYYRVRACNGYGCSLWSQPPRSVQVRPPSCVLSIKNDTGGTLCYEVEGSGIGEKCFSSGTHYYGSFPAGTYRYCASARCGSKCESRYFSSGGYIQRFWCGYAKETGADSQFLNQFE